MKVPNDIKINHSVTLDETKCKGCTNCLKRCPTEAIRVRKGRAWIIKDRCIDCGECLRNCPYHAKKAVCDPLSAIFDYDIKIALPAPSLYGQFDEKYSISKILSAFLYIGFDEVYEVSYAAEIVAQATRDFLLDKSCAKPLISSSCPAVVRLICKRFPSLINNIAPILSPMEIAARNVRNRPDLKDKNAGIFFISPCPAKITSVKNPLGYKKSEVDGVISIKDIYLPLRAAMGKCKEEIFPTSSGKGISWAHIEGESNSVSEKRSISVDGISSVIEVLEAIENDTLKDILFVEAMACPAGCVGGPLVVENPYIAKTRIRNKIEIIKKDITIPHCNTKWDTSVEAEKSFTLHKDMLKAMVMMEEMDQITKNLPGLDCGSCGAPSCHALAEDIVRNKAVLNDCVFKLRENIRKLAEEMLALEKIDPPGLNKS